MKRLIDDLNTRSRGSRTALCGLVAVAALVIAGCGSSHSKSTPNTGSTTGPGTSSITSPGTGSTTSPGTSSTTNPTVPTSTKVKHHDLVTIMQADGELYSPGSNPDSTIDNLAELGASTIRTIAYWNNYAPDPSSHTAPKGFDAANPGAYHASVWATLDAADRRAAQDQVTLYVTLDGGNAPLWATGAGAPKQGVNPDHWKPSAVDYGQWVKAMGLRYSGNYKPKGQSSPLPRIHFWSIWNEPNLGVEIAPVTTDNGKVLSAAAQYRKLLGAGWNALAATGHTPQTDTILIGETAPRGSDSPTTPAGSLAPLPFIRALYCVSSDDKPLRGTAAGQLGCPTTGAGTKAFAAQNPALFKASGWADHPYPDGAAPNVSTQPQGTTGYADFANLGMLITTLDKAAGPYGKVPRFPIYNTEFGYETLPGGSYPQMTQARAAIYLNEAEYLSWINPRVVSYDQYEWHDPQPPSTFTTGLYEWHDNIAKLTLPAFLMPMFLPKTTAAKGSALPVWGCARRAPGLMKATKQPQRVGIQLSTNSGKTFKTIKTVTLDPAEGGCYFDTQVTFPSSGLVRLTWDNNGTNGSIEYSRTQAITLS
jgi:hypothetical protein